MSSAIRINKNLQHRNPKEISVIKTVHSSKEVQEVLSS